MATVLGAIVVLFLLVLFGLFKLMEIPIVQAIVSLTMIGFWVVVALAIFSKPPSNPDKQGQ